VRRGGVWRGVRLGIKIQGRRREERGRGERGKGGE